MGIVHWFSLNWARPIQAEPVQATGTLGAGGKTEKKMVNAEGAMGAEEEGEILRSLFLCTAHVQDLLSL